MNQEQVEVAARNLAAFARACRMQNTLDWMEGLVDMLNAFYAAAGDHQRVETYGHGIGELTPVVGSNLPHIFRPSSEESEE